MSEHKERKMGERANYLQVMDLVELNRFGRYVRDAWGHNPYLVGSSLVRADYRDVDVRLILPDGEYNALFGPPTNPHFENVKWNAHVVAWTRFGQQITGLPLDFQIDQQTEANESYSPSNGHRRSALGIGWER